MATPDVYKRCVDMATVQTKWLTETANDKNCMQYGKVPDPSIAFKCYFACIGHGCNKGLVPDDADLVPPPGLPAVGRR